MDIVEALPLLHTGRDLVLRRSVAAPADLEAEVRLPNNEVPVVRQPAFAFRCTLAAVGSTLVFHSCTGPLQTEVRCMNSDVRLALRASQPSPALRCSFRTLVSGQPATGQATFMGTLPGPGPSRTLHPHHHAAEVVVYQHI